MISKKLFLVFPLLLICLLEAGHAASLSTAFTYQVRVTENGAPANTTYDLAFQLFDAPTNGTQVSATLTNFAVTASNGLITLQLDFGNGLFTGLDRWLQVGARTNGTTGAFVL